MFPTPKSVHVDAALTNISIMHRNQNYIADRVFQVIPVIKQSDYYYKFPKGAWFARGAKIRGPGAEAPRVEYRVATDLYSCLERAAAHPVPIELVNNADTPLRPMATGVEFATDKVLLEREILMSGVVTTGSNWTNAEDAEGGWAATTNGSGNTFIADVLKAKEAIRRLIGVYPNVMILDAKTFKEIKQEYTVLERIKYTGTQGRPADVTAQTLAALFELDEVLVGTSIYSDAEETKAGNEFNAVDLWETNAGKGSCFLYYRPQSPGIETPAAAYVFNWPSDAGQESRTLAAQNRTLVRSVRYWWEDAPKQWVIEASECYDIKVVCADAGYLFFDTILT